MRILALLSQLLIAIASGGAFAWWAATVGMRLIVRRLERSWPLRRGPLMACVAVLLGLALGVSIFVVVAALELFQLVVSAPRWFSVERQWAVWAWKGLTVLAMALLVLAGTGAAFRVALTALGGVRRQRYLTDLSHMLPQSEAMSASPERAGGRLSGDTTNWTAATGRTGRP